jgi:hypothetical protein
MATRKTSAIQSKTKKPQAAPAISSIMINCCSQAVDIVFPKTGNFRAAIVGPPEAPTGIRISHTKNKFGIVGLTASGVNRKTAPWQMFANEMLEKPWKPKPAPKPKAKAKPKPKKK